MIAMGRKGKKPARQEAVSAPLLWFPLSDRRLAVGSGLAPLIPVFRLVRDCWEHA